MLASNSAEIRSAVAELLRVSHISDQDKNDKAKFISRRVAIVHVSRTYK